MRTIPDLRRPLTGFERLMLEVGPSMGADLIALRLEGPIDADRLQQAGKRLVARHPLLRSRVKPGPPAMFVGMDFPTVQVRKSLLHWTHAVQAELHTPFDPVSGPMFRIGFAADGDAHWVWIAAHHAIVDGKALYHLGWDLIRALAGTLPNESLPMPPAPTAPLALNAPMQWAAEQAWLGAIRDHVDQPVVPPRRALAPGELPRSCVAFDALEGSRSLLATARHRNTTVGGAFFAAVRFAVARWSARFGSDPLGRKVGLDVQVNLRGRLKDSPDAEHVSFCTAGVRAHSRLHDTPDFWALARQLGGSVRRSTEYGLPVGVHAFMDGLDGLGMALGRGRIQLGHSAGTTKLVDASNVGPWPFATSLGPWKVTGVHGLCGASMGGAAGIFWLRTLEDKLFLNAVGSEPYVNADDLQTLQTDVSLVLEAVIRGENPTATQWIATLGRERRIARRVA